MDQSLQGLNVVVTRPADQAEGLCSAIKASAGSAIHWPVLKIEAIRESEQTQRFITHLSQYDYIIFISANAANFGLKAIKHHNQEIKQQFVFAVGKATARALQNGGVKNVQIPSIASSKGLLAMPIFSADSILDKRCLIFRGVGGNETLAKGLKQRGAVVNYAEIYQRLQADSNASVLECQWQQQKLDIIVITSIAGLDNLFAILGKNNQRQLCSTPILTVSPRVAEHARKKGFTETVLIANSATDRDIIATMQAWHQQRDKE